MYLFFWLYHAAFDIKETNLIFVLEKRKIACICEHDKENDRKMHLISKGLEIWLNEKQISNYFVF